MTQTAVPSPSSSHAIADRHCVQVLSVLDITSEARHTCPDDHARGRFSRAYVCRLAHCLPFSFWENRVTAGVRAPCPQPSPLTTTTALSAAANASLANARKKTQGNVCSALSRVLCPGFGTRLVAAAGGQPGFETVLRASLDNAQTHLLRNWPTTAD